MAKPSSIPVSCDAEFESLLKRLSEDIVEAPAFLRLDKLLRSKFSEYEREVNNGAFFWTFSVKAIREAGLLRIARIYDQEQRALSLRRLLLTIQANPHFFDDETVKRRVNPDYAAAMMPRSHLPNPTQITNDLLLVSDDDPLVHKIVRWRNTLGAHISAKTTLKRPVIADPLTFEDADNLCTRAFDVFNRYTSLFHATTHSRMIIGEEGSVESIFKFLRLGFEAYDKQVEAEYKRWELMAKNTSAT